MTTDISPSMTIGEIVAHNFRTADVFVQHDIDFCCGGKKTLEKACQERKMRVDDMIDQLQNVARTDNMPSQDPNTWKADFLADHIERTHHRYVRENIPLLQEYTQKIAEVHGARHPELHMLAKQFSLLANDLLEHLQKEEIILFPYVRDLINNGHGRLPSAMGPIHVMEHEHEYAGSLLENIRMLTNDYTVPEDGCTTYQVAFEKLRDFEQDLHWHIHLENNILFPKIMQEENKRK